MRDENENEKAVESVGVGVEVGLYLSPERAEIEAALREKAVLRC